MIPKKSEDFGVIPEYLRAASTVTPRLIMILTTTKTTTPTTKITAGAIVALPILSMNQICCMLLSPAISTKSSILSFPGLLG